MLTMTGFVAILVAYLVCAAVAVHLLTRPRRRRHGRRLDVSRALRRAR